MPHLRMSEDWISRRQDSRSIGMILITFDPNQVSKSKSCFVATCTFTLRHVCQRSGFSQNYKALQGRSGVTYIIRPFSSSSVFIHILPTPSPPLISTCFSPRPIGRGAFPQQHFLPAKLPVCSLNVTWGGLGCLAGGVVVVVSGLACSVRTVFSVEGLELIVARLRCDGKARACVVLWHLRRWQQTYTPSKAYRPSRTYGNLESFDTPFQFWSRRTTQLKSAAGVRGGWVMAVFKPK
ncbi:hypothetical protein JB92DRAFT_2044168 [Gautieria morchelliformis]|nr:hypothetical protein JB92DRAFT_2044168 [Gautieria morchelliformis]